MKATIATIWESYKIEAFLTLVVVGLLLALIFYTQPGVLDVGDTIQIVTLSVLVVVTISYARSTRKLYDVALNSEANAVFPIITLTVEVVSHGHIEISYQNIGRGPALNLRIWLEREGEESFAYLKSESEKNMGFHAAVGVNQDGKRKWDSSGGPLPSRSVGFDVVAEYTDVFRQRFQSKLIIIGIHDQEFSFGRKEQ